MPLCLRGYRIIWVKILVKGKMNITLLIILAITIYVFDVLFLVWASGRFVGQKPLNFSQVGATGLSIILFSCLSISAFFYVPFMIKPLILIISGAFTIYFFIVFTQTHLLKAIVAALFFIFCQFLLLLIVIKQVWNREFFQYVKFMLFQYF